MQPHSLTIVRGSSGFKQACALAASAMALAATPAAASFSALSTPAAKKAERHLTSQTTEAQTPGDDQTRVLRYATYPPVKTTIYGASGRKETHLTLHPFDVVRLAREASGRVKNIEKMTIDPAKIGALLITESALVARVGWSSDGKTPSLGLAQFEPDTAAALAIDPRDPVEAAVGAARLLAEGERFARRHRHIDRNIAISLVYNVSSRLRGQLVEQFGSALALEHLPRPTQHHVKNMAYGQQKMRIYSALYDQHIQQLSHQPADQRKDFTVNTQPSTHALVTGLPTPAMDLVRRENSQRHLEAAGHRVSAVPMTQKGLDLMRAKIYTLAQTMGDRLPRGQLDELLRMGRGEPIIARLAQGPSSDHVRGFSASATNFSHATRATVMDRQVSLAAERMEHARRDAPRP